MEKYLEVMQKTVELADTCLAGIEHISYQIEQGFFEESVHLWIDIACAYVQMEQSLALFEPVLPPNRLIAFMEKLHMPMERVVSAFEESDLQQVRFVSRTELMQEYKAWKQELERCLHPYILS